MEVAYVWIWLAIEYSESSAFVVSRVRGDPVWVKTLAKLDCPVNIALVSTVTLLRVIGTANNELWDCAEVDCVLFEVCGASKV